jgi:antitoxin HicB
MAEVLNSETEYECVVSKAGGNVGWMAEYPDLPGVGAFGVTRAEAVQSGEQVLHAWLAKANELGVQIPKPGEVKSASGEFKIRVPHSLHGRVSELAEIYASSLNETVCRLLTAGVARTFAPEGIGGGQLMCAHLKHSRPSASMSGGAAKREFSGTWIQRTPRILHLHLQRLAEAEGTSVTMLVLYILAFEAGYLSQALLSASDNHANRNVA